MNPKEIKKKKKINDEKTFTDNIFRYDLKKIFPLNLFLRLLKKQPVVNLITNL